MLLEMFVQVQLQPNVCYALHDGDEIKLGDIVCSFTEQEQAKVNCFDRFSMHVNIDFSLQWKQKTISIVRNFKDFYFYENNCCSIDTNNNQFLR